MTPSRPPNERELFALSVASSWHTDWISEVLETKERNSSADFSATGVVSGRNTDNLNPDFVELTSGSVHSSVHSDNTDNSN